MIPSILSSDPWVPTRKRVVLSLTPITRARIAWRPGDEPKVRLARAREDRPALLAERRAEERAAFERRGVIPIHMGQYLELEDLIALAAKGLDSAFVSHHDLLLTQLARHELAALPTFFELYTRWPWEVIAVLGRVDSTEVVSFLQSRGQAARLTLSAWVASYPETAALVLLPAALGSDGEPRSAAIKELRAMRKAGQEAAIVSAAALYGDAAREELIALFAPPPLPPKAPKLPAFARFAVRGSAPDTPEASLGALPELALADGSPLPREAAERLVALASLLPAECARVAVDQALPALDRARLSDLADALLRGWLAAGAATKEKWVIFAAARLGDDRAVRALVTRIEEWADAKLSARVKLALEAIVSIGSEVALMHVMFLTKKKAGPKKAALAALAKYQQEEGLSEDDLADRTVPDLGLDARGTVLFDYGARSFRAGFDEELRPFVLDEAGGRLASLPRASKADDAAKALAAQALWQALKTETKSLATAQVRRMERAMAAVRTWDRAAFERYFWTHPLMQHLARRIVWAVFTHDSGALRPTQTFRIAEDATLSDEHDLACELPAGARIGIVHPVQLSEETRARWSSVFSDYELIQPFPQLGRERFAPTEEERSVTTSKRWSGQRARGERFFALKHRGWHFRDYDMGKAVGDAARPIEATLKTEPGLYFLSGRPEDQVLGELSLVDASPSASASAADDTSRTPPTFGDLSAVAVSELFRDVDALLR